MPASTKPFKLPNKISWAKARLRRASRFWPGANECIKRAKVAPGKYQCAQCQGLFKQHLLKKDHINPVVDVADGYTTMDVWIDRLLCDVSNYQALCAKCHDQKTLLENVARKIFKSKQRVATKKKK